MKWEPVLRVWQQDGRHDLLSVTHFCVAIETTLLLHTGANSVEKNKLVESKKKNMTACMSHLLTHTLRALQFYHCEQPVKAPLHDYCS